MNTQRAETARAQTCLHGHTRCAFAQSVPVWILLALLVGILGAQGQRADPFQQIDSRLPSPTAYRRASGAPSAQYWQQEVDYTIRVELDEDRREIRGFESVVYHNHSPDELRYLWVQLDQNRFARGADAQGISGAPDFADLSYEALRSTLAEASLDEGYAIDRVADSAGRLLAHTIVGTMMRLDLPSPLSPASSFAFAIDWHHPIGDAKATRRRSGYEHFEDDGNEIYEIAQWFPRLAAYSDAHGWHNHQFLGAEFALEFGDYEVHITVPEDHVVAATGQLANPAEVLTPLQQERLVEAVEAERPVFIVTPEEAAAREGNHAAGTQTWVFEAEQVRDFAFASSRKFIWDAQGVAIDGRRVLAMSFWPNEAQPLWQQYSTAAVAHTIEFYSRYLFPYPYPVAISVNGPVGGMEYPMISFQSARPEKDGTYARMKKYELISVIIHEVGHNWFPMIVNTDERRWSWMDEGLNSFVQFLAEQEWEEDYPSRRFERLDGLYEYLQREDVRPVMTAADAMVHGGFSAYAKPTLALNILRETILGRELFDFAFREYARRWRFKRPMPADFFRTLEDASGRDLDWFWHGWFFTTDHVDQAIAGLRRFRIDTRNPEIEKARQKEESLRQPRSLTDARNRELAKRIDRNPELRDFYNDYDGFEVTKSDREDYDELWETLEADDRALLSTGGHFYVIDIENRGALVMPVILDIEYDDGTRDNLRLPSEVWLRDPRSFSKLIHSDREIRRVALDPDDEVADVDRHNNVWPPEVREEEFQLKDKPTDKNPMQRQQSASDPKNESDQDE